MVTCYSVSWQALANTSNPRTSSPSLFLTVSCSPCCRLINWLKFSQVSGTSSQYKDYLSRYGGSHFEEKTVVRPSFLYDENSYTGKTASLYIDGLLLAFTWNSEYRHTEDQLFNQLIGPWEIWIKFYISNFQANFFYWWLSHLLWNCSQMNITGPYWW